MKKGLQHKKVFLTLWIGMILILLVAILLIGIPSEHAETIRETMKDGVLHETNQFSLLGIIDVNPALISAYVVTACLLLGALLIRLLALPRFKKVPGKFQSVIEKLVELFQGIAKNNSPHRTSFVAAYIFSAGTYIFFSTLFELFGIQAVTTQGHSMALPAPLSDINAAMAMGFLSYFVILGAGLMANGLKGGLRVLKDFSLPISMSFRLFGSLLSGLLVTELVYYYAILSFVLPVLIGVLFTLLHAVIQTYVLATLVSVFYGEAVEPPKKKTTRKQTDYSIKKVGETHEEVKTLQDSQTDAPSGHAVSR